VIARDAPDFQHLGVRARLAACSLASVAGLISGLVVGCGGDEQLPPPALTRRARERSCPQARRFHPDSGRQWLRHRSGV